MYGILDHLVRDVDRVLLRWLPPLHINVTVKQRQCLPRLGLWHHVPSTEYRHERELPVLLPSRSNGVIDSDIATDLILNSPGMPFIALSDWPVVVHRELFRPLLCARVCW